MRWIVHNDLGGPSTGKDTAFTPLEQFKLLGIVNEALAIQQTMFKIRDPVQGNLTFSETEAREIQAIFDSQQMQLTLPDKYITGLGPGAPGDMLLLLVEPANAGLNCSASSSLGGTHMAGSMPLWFDQRNGRPCICIVTVCPAFLQDQSAPTAMPILTHELLHSMGFSQVIFNKTFGPDMFRKRQNAYGNQAWMLSSPKAVAWVKDYFDCPFIIEIPMEDEGSSATAGSHWEQSLFMDDLMVGVAHPSMRITGLTLSVMDDLGWYAPSYELQAHANWAAKGGCEIFFSPCSNYASAHPDQVYWCGQGANSSAPACTYDGSGAGFCIALGTTNGCRFVYSYLSCAKYVPASALPSGFFPTCLPTTPSGGTPSVACYAARCDPSSAEPPFASASSSTKASSSAIAIGPQPLYFLVNRDECQSGTTFGMDSRTVVCPSSAQCRFTNCSCDLPGGGVCSLGQSECSSRYLYNTAQAAASSSTQSRRSSSRRRRR